jgi:hypothetical protein
MNWRWILMLSVLGLLMAVASLLGWTSGMELWISIGVTLIAAVLLGYNLPAKHFQNGLMVAVFWGVISGALQYLFYDTFIANNPAAAEKLAQMPEGVDARTMMLVSIPISIIINGLILGLLALVAGKLLREKPAPEVAAPAEQEQQEVIGQ